MAPSSDPHGSRTQVELEDGQLALNLSRASPRKAELAFLLSYSRLTAWVVLPSSLTLLSSNYGCDREVESAIGVFAQAKLPTDMPSRKSGLSIASTTI